MGPTSEVYTHLNCSIKPHETSSNPEKLSPDTLTARWRYTNQMDLGLESISHHQAAIMLYGLCTLAGHKTLLFLLSADTPGQGWRVPISCLASVHKCATKEEGRWAHPLDLKHTFSSSSTKTGKILGNWHSLKKLTRMWGLFRGKV